MPMQERLKICRCYALALNLHIAPCDTSLSETPPQKSRHIDFYFATGKEKSYMHWQKAEIRI